MYGALKDMVGVARVRDERDSSSDLAPLLVADDDPVILLSCSTADDGLLDNILVSQNALADMKTLANVMQSAAVISRTDRNGRHCKSSLVGLTFPSLDQTFALGYEAPCMPPDILSAGAPITSAAIQLIILARPIPLRLFDIMMQVRVNVFLRDDVLLKTRE